MVVDTSAVLAVLLEEPERIALIAATRGATLYAPPSLPWEVGNALVALVRRRRLTLAEARRVWDAFQSVPMRLVDIDVGQAIASATELALYAYDAYMLELAVQRGLPLLTLDQKLRHAARARGVTLAWTL
jgi:predicted nucleic acid-binding protein